MNKKAFTLAEAIITLVFLSIIATQIIAAVNTTRPSSEKVLFRKAYSTIIYGINQVRYWKASKYYEYIIANGLVVKNPEYESHKYRNSYKLNTYQRTYNSKHIINPGAIRSKPIKSDLEFTANSYMKDLRPIYLGKLYVLLNNSLHLVDVYHYYKNFPEWRLEKDPALRIKKENFIGGIFNE